MTDESRAPHTRAYGLALLVVVAVTAAVFVPPVPQDPSYHHFADARTIFGVPNFWNVLSNAGFVLAGIYGLASVSDLPARALRPAYLTFCIAAIGVALGSSWYHYAPSTSALVWDRLPMSVAFMALFSMVIADRLSWRLGRVLLAPLVLLGIGSVLYWAWTEQQGAGDLRPYALVQFLPMISIPVMLLVCPGSRDAARWLWGTFAVYAVAKVAEQLDASIYGLLGLSGHSIKHLLGSVAVGLVVLALLRLRPPEAPDGT